MDMERTVKKARSVSGFITACVVILAGCQSTPMSEAQPVPAAPASQQAADQQRAEYTLDTGDKLTITVFGEAALSGPFQVSDQGDISMPLIGELKAQGRTLRELQRAIEAAYRDGQFLRNPQVSAEVINYRPFYIRGEVKTAGEYPYVAGLTVTNAIARAGDFTYRADRKNVWITSKSSTVARKVPITPSLMVQPGDTIEIKDRVF